MVVCSVSDIKYNHNIPFGTLLDLSSTRVFRLNLMSREYLRRNNIQEGTIVTLTPDKLFVQSVSNNTPISDHVTDSIMSHEYTDELFKRWAIFRGQLSPIVGYNVCRLLFKNGYETVHMLQKDLHDDQHGRSLLRIRGIGPATVHKLKTKWSNIAMSQ